MRNRNAYLITVTKSEKQYAASLEEAEAIAALMARNAGAPARIFTPHQTVKIKRGRNGYGGARILKKIVEVNHDPNPMV